MRIEALNGVTKVVSVVIVAATRPGEVLLGVRRPTSTSDRHPGVLSTPTMRIPDVLFHGVLEQHLSKFDNLEINWKDGLSSPLDSVKSAPIGVANSLDSPVSFAVESLFARKLALADPLIAGTLPGCATPLLLSAENVHDPQGGNGSELTAMVTVLVEVPIQGDLLPTSSYSQFAWARFDRLSEAVRKKDALIVDQSLDPFEVCIDGLCVRSAVTSVPQIFEFLGDRGG